MWSTYLSFDVIRDDIVFDVHYFACVSIAKLPYSIMHWLGWHTYKFHRFISGIGVLFWPYRRLWTWIITTGIITKYMFTKWWYSYRYSDHHPLRSTSPRRVLHCALSLPFVSVCDRPTGREHDWFMRCLRIYYTYMSLARGTRFVRVHDSRTHRRTAQQQNRTKTKMLTDSFGAIKHTQSAHETHMCVASTALVTFK